MLRERVIPAHCTRETRQLFAGGIVADDWVSIHWHKVEYLITCGLKPWYLDHTDPRATPSSTPQTGPQPPHMTPEAPHMLAQHQQGQQHQQQPNQSQQPAGQQQAWAYPVQGSVPHMQPNQAQPQQQWHGAPSGGAGSGSGMQAVATVGQPWQSSPGRWQCDINITLINKGAACLQ